MSENHPTQKEIVICLYDGHYHYGVAALANSMAASHFEGILYVGFESTLPPWVNQLKQIENNKYYLNNDFIIQFEQIKPDIHLAYYKPYFIKQTIQKFPLLNKFFYFDADIVIGKSWKFFSNWLDEHVCLCLDNSFEFVHNNHPWRKDWKNLAGVKETFDNPITLYVNSGFIGITRNNVALIDKWIELTEAYAKWGGDLKIIDQDGHNSYKGDQDILNAAITVSPQIGLSIIGKEGMGFTHPAYLMTHAIAKIKPWKKNYILHLINSGHKPGIAEKNFFNYCKYPIKLFPSLTYILKRVNIFVASFLGRYIGY